jgi:predicted dehydrogenase/threonine dehydrogenase-like Zn-dependent dehydrogenase
VKQILQHLRTGQLEVAELPCPIAHSGHLLIQTTHTLISAGTERMMVEFGKAGLISKARSQPDKVKQVLDKIRTDGLLPTMEAVFNRLDEPLPLGYCNVGRVLEVGAGVAGYAPGDRVASNGPHAEVVCVPKNLCAKIPDEVDDPQATFTVLASIGLQGIRLLGPTFGERFVVFGLGLIGLVTVQLLRGCGCEVLGIDIAPERLELAERMGARTARAGAGSDPVVATSAWTEGRGADGVLITASAKTDEIVHQSAEMCRKRGRIVLVGVVGLNLRRSDFYDKELSFQVSCSYGPGRYDDSYEQGGRDYPYGLVRWTEQRNFEAILGAMRSGSLRVDDLITHRYAQADAAAAYETITSDGSALGVVLEYPEPVERAPAIVIEQSPTPGGGQAVLGVIGAGNFSKMTLMPNLARTEAQIAYVADLNAAAARHLANKFGAGQAITDYKEMLADDRVDGVLIAVGHNLHAGFVCEVLAAGKHAFVEKPLAMNVEELADVLEAASAHPELQIMVGFNRRFSPHTLKMRELLAGRSEPLAMTMTVNAGHIPPDHWIQDPNRGGGRIIGEACHFIDLMVCLAGAPVKSVAAAMVGAGVATRDDKMSITVGFEDGSIGSLSYLANGSRAYPKELLEVFSEGRVLRLDNFRRLAGFGFKNFSKFRTSRLDKGHAREFAEFADRVSTGGAPLIPLAELTNVTLASFAAMTSSAECRTIIISDEYADRLRRK